MDPIGRKRWAIGEGYIPGWSHGPEPEMKSHETACLMNASSEEAHVTMMVLYEDREPAGLYEFTVAPRRTRHIRLEELEQPEPIPKGTGYSLVLESDVPIVVQHTRLDSRQAENALFSTIAFAGSE